MITAPLVDRILAQLDQLRVRCPEIRFGQLIAIIGELAQDETGHSLWDVEDSDFAAALERFAADMARRQSDRAAPGTSSGSRSTLQNPDPNSDTGKPTLGRPG
jgi:hypothetical protein